MVNYLNELKSKINKINTEIANKNNELEKIDLRVELLRLQDIVNNIYQEVFNNFEQEVIIDFARNILSNESIDLAIAEKDRESNKETKKKIEENFKKQLETNQQILRQHLNIYNDALTNKDSEGYKRAEQLQKDIKTIESKIEEFKKKEPKFQQFLSEVDKEALFNHLLDNMDKGAVSKDEITEKVKNYKPLIDVYAHIKYQVNDEIDEIIKNNPNQELCDFLAENKDEINRLTQYTDHDSLVEYNNNRIRFIDEEMTKMRHNQVEEACKEKGISHFQNDGVLDDIKTQDKGFLDEFKVHINEMKLSQDNKENIKNLLVKMDSLGLVDENSYGGESSYKEYGFTNYVIKKANLVNLIRSKNPSKEEISKAFTELKKEEEKILSLYESIEETLSNDYIIPGNVDSCRTVSVPQFFKEKIGVHAKFNSLYVALTFIKQNNISIDDFVNKPFENIYRALERKIDEIDIDKKLEGKDKSQALIHFYDAGKERKYEDAVQYTRAMELLVVSEKNPQFQKDNVISMEGATVYVTALCKNSHLNSQYLRGAMNDTIQNIFLIDPQSKDPHKYRDAYIPSDGVCEDPVTGTVKEDVPSIIDKLAKTENVQNYFYDAIAMLKNFTQAKMDDEIAEPNRPGLTPSRLLEVVQEFAAKIIVTLDIKNNQDIDENFKDDLINIINDYKEFDVLKDFNYKIDNDHLGNLVNVIENRDRLYKNAEKNIMDSQKTKEDEFIKEFERINKEIDILDAKADKIGKKIGKGNTNEEIENIALEQQRKFKEIINLQNARLEDLKSDLRMGKITQYYFDVRAYQISTLENVKNIPAMFKTDSKDYANFDNYLKKVLKTSHKELKAQANENIRNNSAKENSPKAEYKRLLSEAKNQYLEIVKEIKEEKKLYIINETFVKQDFAISRSVNHFKFDSIKSEDNLEEMKELSLERLRLESEKTQIVVDLGEANEKEELLIKEEDQQQKNLDMTV